ncbi:glycosyltransferase [Planctomonas psychrotolerans]|uniref:glycosyltransferase n=1 Tax=Planctomonas psychrotolerans TaxID=2528712 RepID=UPI00123B3790|nr:glycosyltransferase [Planctomonas psychrotolerans]
MRVLVWHVHGGWMDSFVRGTHDYLIPLPPGEASGAAGRGWGANVREVDPAALRDEQVDVVVAQDMAHLKEAERLLGRRPGRDVRAVYVEHNTPRGGVPNAVHPLADRSDIPIVHVTHFNNLIWDSGSAPAVVVEHGVPDPGALYTGERAALGVVINEPVRRWRVTGTDLLPRFAAAGPIVAFGIAGDLLPAAVGLDDAYLSFGGDLPPAELHASLARCRAYLHPVRWTSLGLSLLEAMHLAMPVVVLASTEAPRAVPPEAGAISADVDALVRESRRLLADPDEARRRGRVAREVALERYSLAAFLRRWDEVLADG